MCAKNNNEVRTFKSVVDEFNFEYPDLLFKIIKLLEILEGNQPILATEKEHKSLCLIREYLKLLRNNIRDCALLPLRNYYKPSEVEE